MVKVHCMESLANYRSPESCVAVREGCGEALTGDCIGQPLSLERLWSQVPTLFALWKAKRAGALWQAPERPGEAEDPGMCRRALYGNREIWVLAGSKTPVRIGKARSHSR